MRFRRSGSAMSRRNDDWSASASSDGDNRPVSSGITASRTPPTSVATTGSAALIASRMLYGKASEREESTNTCEAAINSLTSRRKPSRRTRSSSPNSPIRLRISGSNGPSPTRSRRHARDFKPAKAFIRVTGSFGCSMRATISSCGG